MKFALSFAVVASLALALPARGDLLLDDYNDSTPPVVGGSEDYNSGNGGEDAFGIRATNGAIAFGQIELDGDAAAGTNGEMVMYTYAPGVALGMNNAFRVDLVDENPDAADSFLTLTAVTTAGMFTQTLEAENTLSAPLDTLTFYFGSGIVGSTLTKLTIQNTSDAFLTSPSISFDNLTAVAVPEPFSLALCGLAVGGGGVVYRRRRRRAAA